MSLFGRVCKRCIRNDHTAWKQTQSPILQSADDQWLLRVGKAAAVNSCARIEVQSIQEIR